MSQYGENPTLPPSSTAGFTLDPDTSAQLPFVAPVPVTTSSDRSEPVADETSAGVRSVRSEIHPGEIPPVATAGSTSDTPVLSNTGADASVRLAVELPPKPSDARFHTLDIVRGVACVMLMLYHATFYAERSWESGDPTTWTAGGLAINLIGRLWMGVPMFFVVSGYCIAASIDSLRRKPHSLGSYFWKRFRRIYPPLWAGFVFAVVITLLVSTNAAVFGHCLQLPRLSSFSMTDWIANLAAGASWMPQLVGAEGKHLLLNTWTLCYEEQFYAVAGLLLVFASRRFFMASYVIAGATIIIRHLCRYFGMPISGMFFDGHWLMFAAGILMYQHLNYMTNRQRRLAFVTLGLGAIYGLAERVLASDPRDRHIGEYILVACVFAIGLIAIKRWDTSIVQHAVMRPFRWLGKISYSLYLTHFPVTVLLASLLAMMGVREDGMVFLVTIPLCFFISLPIAMLFYQLVERHTISPPKQSET